MQLSEPVGRLDGERLVHTASGMELLSLPPANDWNAETLQGITLLFEGTPGVALVLAGPEARVARMNDGKIEWATVLKTLARPPMRAALDATRKTGEGLPTGDEAPRVTKIAAKGYPEGLTVMLTTKEIVVASSPDIDTDLQYGNVSETGGINTCSGVYKASVQVGTLADGSTLMRYERVENLVVDDGGCEDAMEGHYTIVEWLHFPATGGAPRVIESAKESSDGYTTGVVETGLIDLPRGTLKYVIDRTEEMMGGESGQEIWTLLPVDGPEVELASRY